MNTELQDTNVIEEPQEVETEEKEVTQEEQTEATGEAESNDTEASADAENVEEETPFLVCKYNKNDVALTKEKAQEWAQKGMHYDAKLDYLATINGCTINELLKKSIDDIDNKERQRLEEQFGNDTETIEKMMKIFHAENQTKYENAVSERKVAEEQQEQSRLEKIGEEFVELQKQFPELKEIKDIPDSVLKDTKNMSLEHAYLKYKIKELNKIEVAKKQEQAAKETSSGSLNTEAGGEDNLIAAMVAGVNGR